jgi:23S rRNA pseudouridine2605 synthase
MAAKDHTPAGDRIAKVIARAGLCSRREAEAWIAAGRVAVNGAVVSSPALNVTPEDRVVVDGAPLPQRERTRLFLYHKPRGLVTTHADPQGRPTIFAALPKTLPRLLSIGRLDMNTEGLLLLTNDGGLARTLELPATGWLRRYRVRAHGRVPQERLDALRNGVTVDGIRYGPIDAKLEREQGANVWLVFAMREGKNREVKNVLGHLGLAVSRLIRVSFGPFQLGDLPEGAVEEVRTRHLREQLSERIAALAGVDFTAPIVQREEAEATPHPAGTKARTPEPESKPRHHRRPAEIQSKPRIRNDKRKKRGPSASERLGEPELARREQRRRKFRGKRR